MLGREYSPLRPNFSAFFLSSPLTGGTNRVQYTQGDIRTAIHNQIDAVQTECNYFAERCDKNFSRYKQLIRAYYDANGVEYYPERGADWFPDWGSSEVHYDAPEPGSYCNSRHDSNEGWGTHRNHRTVEWILDC